MGDLVSCETKHIEIFAVNGMTINQYTGNMIKGYNDNIGKTKHFTHFVAY